MTVPGFPSLTLGAPIWLWALAILPLMAALFAWGERRRIQLLQRLVAARLQPVLAGSVSLVKRRLHFTLVLGALACFGLALAQPRYGYTVEEAKRKGRDVLIAVDTSRSMLANDVKPNRLERAKFAAQDLINSLEGDRLGLIAFAGSAFLQAPLTVDYTAVFSALNELDTNIIPLGGTDIAEAIRTAADAFGKGESQSRCLVLFTDGEDLGADAIDAARKAAGTMRIFTVGVGSADGSLIPVPGEEGGTQFIKGPDGQFVKSRLDEKTLAAIAEATGGFYSRLQNGPADMHRLVAEGLGKMKEQEIDARLSHRPIERYQWPLGLGIALIMSSVFVNERRRKSLNGLALLLALALLVPNPASAATSEELYQQKRFEEARKQYEEALKLQPDSAELHFNKGATHFELNDYENAIAEFSKALRSSDPQLQSKAEYNLGTTLLNRALKNENDPKREADLKNAEQHLSQAAQLNPQIAKKAAKNKAIAKRELEKPTPPPSSKDQKQDDKKDQQSKDQQSKDQQSKDQQSKDQQPGAPQPPNEEQKLSGEIKANDSKPNEKQDEQAEGEIPVKPGEMSPNQARAVLDSLKGEDGQPFKTKQRSAAPVLKDW